MEEKRSRAEAFQPASLTQSLDGGEAGYPPVTDEMCQSIAEERIGEWLVADESPPHTRGPVGPGDHNRIPPAE